MRAREHKPVVHAVSLLGRIKQFQVESHASASRFAQERGAHQSQRSDRALSGSVSMRLVCLFKSGRVIATMASPHRKDDPDPDVGQCPHGHGMAFAFGPFPLVIGSGPRLALGRRPRELMKRIAQGLDTARSAVGFGIPAALKQHGRGSPSGGLLLASW